MSNSHGYSALDTRFAIWPPAFPASMPPSASVIVDGAPRPERRDHDAVRRLPATRVQRSARASGYTRPKLAAPSASPACHMQPGLITARVVAALLSLSLVAGCTVGALASGSHPSAPGARSSRTLRGSLEGASYVIQVPGSWNGVLLIYSHGGGALTPNPAAENAVDPVTSAYLLDHGYALTGSSFRSSGWFIEDALADDLALLGEFRRLVGRPTRTIAWGASLGSMVTLGLAERNPDRIDGALGDVRRGRGCYALAEPEPRCPLSRSKCSSPRTTRRSGSPDPILRLRQAMMRVRCSRPRSQVRPSEDLSALNSETAAFAAQYRAPIRIKVVGVPAAQSFLSCVAFESIGLLRGAAGESQQDGVRSRRCNGVLR
jgi:pimeloyl-ACP methyl ester carboxylesterase